MIHFLYVYDNRHREKNLFMLPYSIFVILIHSFLIAGCTQPAMRPVVTTLPTKVTTIIPSMINPSLQQHSRSIQQRSSSRTREGPDADQIIELETTVINSKGSVKTQFMDSRLDTTPVQGGGTAIFQRPYTETARVLIIGPFPDGTHQDILVIWI
jgi:hypothetical protein